MKTYKFTMRRCLFALVALLGGITCALAATDAGETITNLATVSYEDALGNSFQVQSNEAIVTVAQVYSATIEADRTTIAAPLTQVSFLHTLTNTGNGTDTYTIDGTEFAATTAPGAEPGADVDSNIAAIYLDTNGNNVADAGDTLLWDGTTVLGTVTLAAGEEGTLIMLVDVPTGADGDVLYASLNAAGTSGTVDDLTSANGLDVAEGTNDDTITITTGPAFNVVKTASVTATGVDHSAIDGTLTSANVIEYTVQVTNTGGATATDVNILDAIPDGTFLVPGSISSIGLGNGGDDAGASTTFDETTGAFANGGADSDPFDANVDGDSADTVVDVIRATDASMTVGTTVSVTFEVAYDPTNTDFDTAYGDNDGSLADEAIENTAYADVDADGSEPTASNPESILLADVVTYGVDLDDTDGVDTGAGDDDATDNDTQFVTSAYDGQTVLFDNVLTNNGSATDSFIITADTGTSTFPAGTTFRFYTSTGIELVGGETPQVPAGGSITIQVRATLPSPIPALALDGATAIALDAGVYFPESVTANGTQDAGEDFTVTTTATSVGDGVSSDTKTEALGEVEASRVDIANGVAGATDAADDVDPILAAPTTTNTADGGATTTFQLEIANESGAPDSFLLTSGSDTLAPMTALPAGWTVTFVNRGIYNDSNVLVTADDSAEINSTELLPAGYSQRVDAIVSIPADALAGDQEVYFRAESANTGLVDTKWDRVTVNVTCLMDVSTSPEGSINAGGTQDFLHSFTNTSNEAKAFSITIDETNLDAGWTSTLLVDATADQIVDPNTIFVADAAATIWNPTEVVGAFVGTAITLQPGETVYFIVKLFAPSDAVVDSTSSVDITVAADGTDPDCSSVVTDVAHVVPPMDLAKTVAVDPTCSCDSTGLSFMGVQSDEVAPGECVIWRLVAHNESIADALNVEINDARTDFTDFEPTGDGTPHSCAGNPAACTSSDYTATVSGSDISWDVGTLAAGAYATAEFCVKVQ